MNNEKKNPFENPIVQQRFLGGAVALYFAGFVICILPIFISGLSAFKGKFGIFQLLFIMATASLTLARVNRIFYLFAFLGIVALFTMDTFWGF